MLTLICAVLNFAMIHVLGVLWVLGEHGLTSFAIRKKVLTVFF